MNSLSTRGRCLLAFLIIVLVILLGHLLGADRVGDTNGKPTHASVLVHVAGPTDSGGAYHADEDRAWCLAPAVEVAYSSNPDGSGTVECRTP